MSCQGFYRGTSHDQVPFFANKEKKMIENKKWPPEFEKEVDISKVNMQVISSWITKRITELLGFEDEIVIDYCRQQLLPQASTEVGSFSTEKICPKKLQINMTGFLAKNASSFVKDLWSLLLNAQESESGIPEQFLEERKKELATKQLESEKLREALEKVQWVANSRSFSNNEVNRDSKLQRNAPENNSDVDNPFLENINDRTTVSNANVSPSETSSRSSSYVVAENSSPPHDTLDTALKDKALSNKLKSSPRSCSRPRRRASLNHTGRSSSLSRRRSRSRFYKRRYSSGTRQSRSRSPGRKQNSSLTPREDNSPLRRRSRSLLRRRSRSSLRRRSRSPLRRRSRSPLRRRSRSPLRRRSRSPLRRRSRSPLRQRSRSPWRQRSRSPWRQRSRSPWRQRSRSPLRRRSRSPLKRRSPSPLRRRSRSPLKQRSPSPLKRRSRSPLKRESPSPLKRRTRSPLKRRSRSPLKRRSRSPLRRRSRSPARRRSRSPLRRRSRSPLRQRSRSPLRRKNRSPLRRKSRLHLSEESRSNLFYRKKKKLQKPETSGPRNASHSILSVNGSKSPNIERASSKKTNDRSQSNHGVPSRKGSLKSVSRPVVRDIRVSAEMKDNYDSPDSHRRGSINRNRNLSSHRRSLAAKMRGSSSLSKSSYRYGSTNPSQAIRTSEGTDLRDSSNESSNNRRSVERHSHLSIRSHRLNSSSQPHGTRIDLRKLSGQSSEEQNLPSSPLHRHHRSKSKRKSSSEKDDQSCKKKTEKSPSGSRNRANLEVFTRTRVTKSKRAKVSGSCQSRQFSRSRSLEDARTKNYRSPSNSLGSSSVTPHDHSDAVRKRSDQRFNRSCSSAHFAQSHQDAHHTSVRRRHAYAGHHNSRRSPSAPVYWFQRYRSQRAFNSPGLSLSSQRQHLRKHGDSMYRDSRDRRRSRFSSSQGRSTLERHGKMNYQMTNHSRSPWHRSASRTMSQRRSPVKHRRPSIVRESVSSKEKYKLNYRKHGSSRGRSPSYIHDNATSTAGGSYKMKNRRLKSLEHISRASSDHSTISGGSSCSGYRRKTSRNSIENSAEREFCHRTFKKNDVGSFSPNLDSGYRRQEKKRVHSLKRSSPSYPYKNTHRKTHDFSKPERLFRDSRALARSRELCRISRDRRFPMLGRQSMSRSSIRHSQDEGHSACFSSTSDQNRSRSQYHKENQRKKYNSRIISPGSMKASSREPVTCISTENTPGSPQLNVAPQDCPRNSLTHLTDTQQRILAPSTEAVPSAPSDFSERDMDTNGGSTEVVDRYAGRCYMDQVGVSRSNSKWPNIRTLDLTPRYSRR